MLAVLLFASAAPLSAQLQEIPPLVRFDGQKIVCVTTTNPQQVEAVMDLTGDSWSHGFGEGRVNGGNSDPFFQCLGGNCP